MRTAVMGICDWLVMVNFDSIVYSGSTSIFTVKRGSVVVLCGAADKAARRKARVVKTSCIVYSAKLDFRDESLRGLGRGELKARCMGCGAEAPIGRFTFPFAGRRTDPSQPARGQAGASALLIRRSLCVNTCGGCWRIVLRIRFGVGMPLTTLSGYGIS